jgi:hypothetical protein
MQPDRLKSLVETGNYRPQPALIAEAMLRRDGVRELLGEPRREHPPVTLTHPTGRTPSAQASGPRAA